MIEVHAKKQNHRRVFYEQEIMEKTCILIASSNITN